ncbi:amidase [Sphingopyxis sp. GC21]|uniref:amidase n=1 Tax=Sphingopyxis sp. GC21 TaxID=2933562 RepID=UPI0021E3E2AF|nr:amidase [Sphingopyxis sp. GC21]
MMHAPAHRAIFLTGPFPGNGMRVAVKDCFDVAGEVTASGSRALAWREPAPADAEAVARLRAGGCTISGRVTMHELAYGVTGINGWTGTPINPFYPSLVPGGSSSGCAAAVAAGLVDVAIGTDTGGSVRVPAACCGIVGFKPSFGRVSRRGVEPAESSLDCVGPLARTVPAIEQAMAMLCEWTGRATPLAARIGFISGGPADPVIQAALAGAAFRATIETVTLARLGDAQAAGLAIIGRETARAHAALLGSGLLGADVEARLRAASQIDDCDIAEAENVRSLFCAEVDHLLETFDAIVLPTLAGMPVRLHDADNAAAAIAMTAHCRPFNLSGHPAIALPVGEVDGVPVSLQLVGRPGGDEALCALARAIPLFSKGESA